MIILRNSFRRRVLSSGTSGVYIAVGWAFAPSLVLSILDAAGSVMPR
jgi:hypothetical protein